MIRYTWHADAFNRISRRLLVRNARRPRREDENGGILHAVGRWRYQKCYACTWRCGNVMRFSWKKKGSKNSHPFPATTRGLMAHGFSLRLCIVRRLPIELSPSRRILQNKYKQISMAINSTEEKNINVITYGSISCTNTDRSIRIISRTYPENDRQKFNSIPRIIYWYNLSINICVHGKVNFDGIFKNLIRYRSENNFCWTIKL